MSAELAPWVARYRRAVLDHLGAPDDVDLNTVEILTSWEEAGGYSEYTNWDASIEMTVSWDAPADESSPHSWLLVRKGDRVCRGLTNEDVAALINSFG